MLKIKTSNEPNTQQINKEQINKQMINKQMNKTTQQETPSIGRGKNLRQRQAKETLHSNPNKE